MYDVKEYLLYGSIYKIWCLECNFKLTSESYINPLTKEFIRWEPDDRAQKELENIFSRFYHKVRNYKKFDKEVKIIPKWLCPNCKKYVKFNFEVENKLY